MLRKDVKEHLSAYCRFREEKCFYCKRDVVVTNLQVRAGTVGGRTAQMEPRVEERVHLDVDMAPLTECLSSMQRAP